MDNKLPDAGKVTLLTQGWRWNNENRFLAKPCETSKYNQIIGNVLRTASANSAMSLQGKQVG